MADRFVHELRVRYGECDPQGIVFNANYLLYFDVAITEFWRHEVVPWQEMAARGIEFVVGEANLRFRAPARNDDVLQLELRVTRLGTSGVTTGIDIVRDGELLIEGWLRHVCVDGETFRKRPIPDWIRAGLERFTDDGGAAR
jgi:acyl-CoA thioester hydrolase